MSALIRKTYQALPPSLKARLQCLRARLSGREKIFTSIYINHAWEGHSVSGGGSDLDQTTVLQLNLPVIFKEIGARRILDAPCGDFNWMQHTPLELDEYIGADIVANLVAANQAKYADATKRFIQLDIVKHSIPMVDIILCRDCLVHLPYGDIMASLRNFKRSGSTYLLTTTFPDQKENNDIVIGQWRAVNLQLHPFNFPVPMFLLNENCPDKGYQDKSLGLWKLTDIPL